MLPKKRRLSVQSVIGKKGAIRRGRYMLLKTFPTAVEQSRFAVVVGKKVSPSAARRNALRRRVYRALSERLREFPPGQDILITLLPTVSDEPAEHGMILELEAMLRSSASSNYSN